MSEYFRKPIVKTLMLKGQEGQSIKGIEKTGTDVLVDTYTITLTDGTTSTFTVTNGKGISNISKTGTSGLVDTYTITFNDGTKSTFTVTNGKEISGVSKTDTSGLVDTYTITFNDGTTSTFTVTNGAKGDRGDTGPQGPQGLKGDKGESNKPAVDALEKRLDNLILSSGNESSAEVVDARTGYDGTAYNTLGTAIRTQFNNLKSDLDGTLYRKIRTSGIGQFNQDSNAVNSIKYNEYNDLVWTFKRNTGYIAAFVEISNPDKFKVKKYTASIYNPNPFNIGVRLYISTNGYNWSPDNAYVSNIVSLNSGEKKSVQIDNSKYDNIKNSSGHVYLIYETIYQSDLGKNTNVLTCVFESNSMQSELGFSVSAENAQNAVRLIGFEPSEYVKKADVSSLINAEKYITCWGDSLTAGGGWTNTLQKLSNMTVYNGGTGGEGSNTIVARQGADVMMINNITIPSDTTPVIIAKRSVDGGITTFEGKKVTPLLQGGSHVNPCKIGDVVGTLKWTGSDYADANGTWTFERNEIGNQVIINRPTAIRTDYDMNRNAPYLMVIFIGQNGGYSDIDDLIRQHRLMIEHSKARHVVVLGLSSGTKAERASYEARMRKEFGRYFISLREYLSTPIYDNSGTIISCYGMEDQNVSIDSSYTYNGKTTLQEIQEGSVPHQILADGVHYTSGTKEVIGKMLYKKCCELGIF